MRLTLGTRNAHLNEKITRKQTATKK